MFSNIPEELRSYPQWVCWRYEIIDGRTTKVPYSPITGYPANVKNPAHWSSFADAVAKSVYFNGIGFVLTDNDPYTGIDIDNKPENPASPEEIQVHYKIFEAFPSYTERSVGGHGYHIIIRGKVKAGSDRGHVGVYSTDRYLTFTGDVVRHSPILECQAMLDRLVSEMLPAPKSIDLIEYEETISDTDLINMAINAENADKFNRLCAGQWQDEYPSQSEADFALLSMFAFYSQSNEQCRRLFRMTALGKRAKATRNDDYLNRALSKIRGRQELTVAPEQAAINAQAILNQKPKTKTVIQPQPITQQTQQMQQPPLAMDVAPSDLEAHTIDHQPQPNIPLPPGIIGELATYFYQAAPRPVAEIALSAAIALVAGAIGRNYNISNYGLNQYLILLAKTGTGKEAAQSGISKMIAATRLMCPPAADIMGPSHFASGQGLLKYLGRQPCFVSILGEFGLLLQQLTDPRANSAQKMFQTALLDIYGKSGAHEVYNTMVYSDVEKNTAPIRAPNVTLLGESTPESFFEGLDESHLSSGLIPRFLIIEYTGPRPPLNDHANFPPPPELVRRFSDLIAIGMAKGNGEGCHRVDRDSMASRLFRSFEKEATREINKFSVGAIPNIWNRAHLNALKLAALIAVGVNPHNPIIDEQIADWSITLVRNSVNALCERFRTGNIGSGDDKQIFDLKHVVENYFHRPSESILTNKNLRRLHLNKIIPYAYLQTRTSCMSSFRTDKYGATIALKKAVQTLLDSGFIVEVNRAKLDRHYEYSGIAYAIGTAWQS